jgi:hypothetical protein
MYSASVVERETLFCLVLDELRAVPPIRYTYPDVDLRSGRFPPPIGIGEAHKTLDCPVEDTPEQNESSPSSSSNVADRNPVFKLGIAGHLVGRSGMLDACLRLRESRVIRIGCWRTSCYAED